MKTQNKASLWFVDYLKMTNSKVIRKFSRLSCISVKHSAYDKD